MVTRACSWSQLPHGPNRRWQVLSFVTMVRLWHEHPCTCTCCSTEVPSLSLAANFLSSFRTRFSCFTPCSPSRDYVSISRSPSFVIISASTSSNNGSCTISSSPTSCTSLSLLLLSSVLLTVKYFFS